MQVKGNKTRQNRKKITTWMQSSNSRVQSTSCPTF